ncbi:alanyl-tRNA editing protein [Marinibaculum pumilum]|uniref:Alanine--tRNA ligase n=1 Tax=Marinibaculum pumilum TaxID=1766165 RepID=A0ABV7KWJ8_9PROT
MTLLFRDDPYLAETTATVLAATPEGIRLDRTIFYPMGGGQPGDTGSLLCADGTEVAVIDTRKGPEGPEDVLHIPAGDATLPAAGSNVTLRLDWPRRHRLMRMHSCLHLLSAVLPLPVTGGQISDGKGRLDFDATGADVPDKAELTTRINELIEGDYPLQARWIEEAELEGNPDLVKTMAVKPPRGAGRVRLIEVAGGPDGRHLDLQACGGTHVARTGEIGPIEVRKLESKGRQNRRVTISFADE